MSETRFDKWKGMEAYVFPTSLEEWKALPEQEKIYLVIDQYFNFGEDNFERGAGIRMRFSVQEIAQLKSQLEQALAKAEKFLDQEIEEIESRLTN